MEWKITESLVLERSYDVRLTMRRQRMVLAYGICTLIAFALLLTLVESRLLTGSITALYVAITVAEKWAYGRGVLAYKSVIRKLAARIEELEADAPVSPGT